MLLKEIIVVYSENHTKYAQTNFSRFREGIMATNFEVFKLLLLLLLLKLLLVFLYSCSICIWPLGC
jgi:hypothetical protein